METTDVWWLRATFTKGAAMNRALFLIDIASLSLERTKKGVIHRTCRSESPLAYNLKTKTAHFDELNVRSLYKTLKYYGTNVFTKLKNSSKYFVSIDAFISSNPWLLALVYPKCPMRLTVPAWIARLASV